jgi:hypothetical protein
MGPGEGGDDVERTLPGDYRTNPFRYLPPVYDLSEAEARLAEQYERGDFSGGYAASQIAHFRRPLPAEQHAHRRARLAAVQRQLRELGLSLPATAVTLFETDEFVDRLRHPNVWPELPDHPAPLPGDPSLYLVLMFGEGQGCGYWHQLLGREGDVGVVFSEHPFGCPSEFPSGLGPQDDPDEVMLCADSFEEWAVNYFFECIEEDRHYAETLVRFPGL